MRIYSNESTSFRKYIIEIKCIWEKHSIWISMQILMQLIIQFTRIYFLLKEFKIPLNKSTRNFFLTS